ncbi:hypothetical protein HMPREF9336_04086 [Segniliparus rugosus ATCC BAA-974]|uniref:Uncharacterized protein n=1 Tax=Segniliparus rugosus (strain ATCC BAA-974 / DSM 45345 / CCUG 50838 / CIP 108380 / JCM 13579 / CDC 945) TaxID=679197 RepID=U1M2Q3_SEGRC|nr:hypothetical protein HMPREF9336_04086 [Segniliparus rugosus ATCC BAA-974]
MSRWVRIGEGTTICGAAAAPLFGFAPSATRSVMLSASRMLSSGGLVACANRCEKCFATPPSWLESALMAAP